MENAPHTISSFESEKIMDFWVKNLQNWVYTEIPKWYEVKKNGVKNTKVKNIAIPQKLSNSINRLTLRTNIPVQTIFLTAHCKVLSTLSGNVDITTGYKVEVPKPNTGKKENDDSLSNTMPLRIKCGSSTWKDFANKVNQVEKEILPFCHISLNQVQKGLKLTDKIFESTFQFKEVKGTIENHSTDLLKDIDNDFILNTEFLGNFNEGGFVLSLYYDSNQLHRAQIENISKYYLNTLKLMCEDEFAFHEETTIIPEEEEETLLEQFNNNIVDLPSNKTFVHLFEEQVQKSPNAIAVRFQNIEWTYSELNSYSNQLAKQLIGSGLEIEQSVVVVMDRNQLWYATVLGIFKAGGVYVPVRPDWPQVRKRTIINKTHASFIITNSNNENDLIEIRKKTEHSPKLINIDNLLIEDSQETNPRSIASPDNLAYIIFTSGSTGEPKGAMIEHKGMLNHLFSKVNDLGLVQGDNIAQNSSQSFDISVWQLICGALVGAKTVIYSDALILDIHKFLYQVKEDNITILELVPSYLEILLQLCNGNDTTFNNLKYMLVTGEPLKIGLVTSWFNFIKKIPLVNAYGPTEASDDITHHFMYKAPENSLVPVGTPIQNLKIYVVDSFGQLAPTGTKGQVYVSGIGVGRGYIGDLERTNAVFTKDYLKPKENLRLYKTGDIGCWTPKGVLHLFGREDSQIKLNGYRIDLGEIEQCLSKQNGVTENAVLLKEKQLHAFLVFDGKINNDQGFIEQCKSGLHQDLPHYMVPRKFHVLQNLPLTPNGKIDRMALQKIIIPKKKGQ